MMLKQTMLITISNMTSNVSKFRGKTSTAFRLASNSCVLLDHDQSMGIPRVVSLQVSAHCKLSALPQLLTDHSQKVIVMFPIHFPHQVFCNVVVESSFPLDINII
jgi:hypothetical protein